MYSVQVKRLKSQNPLDAVIIRGSKRKRSFEDENSDNSDVVFRLAETHETQQLNSKICFESSNDSNNEHKLSLMNSKRQKTTNRASKPSHSNLIHSSVHDQGEHLDMMKDDDQHVHPELQSMLAEYIEPQQAPPNAIVDDFDKETESYVYDVYYSDKAGNVDPNSRTGSIDLDDNNWKLLFDDDEKEESLFDLHGDEDSNAEDYYKNDYPSASESEEDKDSLIFDSDEEGDEVYSTNQVYFNSHKSIDEPLEFEEISDDEFEKHRYGW